MGISDNIIGNILGKPKSRGGKNDWDGDGVRNKKDCQPRNTMRQDRSYGELRQLMQKTGLAPPELVRRGMITQNEAKIIFSSRLDIIQDLES